MGKFEDFIADLDGQSEINVVDVVAKLHKLHNEELSTGAAKIQTLTDQLSEKDAVIAEKDNQLRDAKSANWDLVNRIPGESQNDSEKEDEGEINHKLITLDDAFAQ